MDDLLSPEDLFEASGRYGYQHPSYAEAYVELGEVRHLRRSGAWMLTREIAKSGRRDALVGHPLTVCRDWSAVSGDLVEAAALTDVVTVSALSDPLGIVREETLRQAFPDLVRVHAQHYIAELATFWPSRDHRREVRRAMQLVDIDIEESPKHRIDDWATLSGNLRGLAGMGSIELSGAGLGRELGVPGCVGLTALAEEGPVAIVIAYVSGDVAHIHAVVSTARGEQLGARYALFQAAVEDMAGRGLYALDLGTATSDERSVAEAEKRFMDGWTELLRPSYRCGRIVDRVAYDELCAAAGTAGSAAFPAYRDPAARLGADTSAPDTSVLDAIPHDDTQGDA